MPFHQSGNILALFYDCLFRMQAEELAMNKPWSVGRGRDVRPTASRCLSHFEHFVVGK